MKSLKYHMNLSRITKNINFILLIILVIFVILSFMIRNLPGGDTHWSSINTEFGFIENTQLILLIYAIYLNIRRSKKILTLGNKPTLLLRIFTLIFIFYEEISFLSANKFKTMESLTFSSELNFHQLKFLDNNIFENLRAPLLNYDFSITISVFFYTLILLIIGFGGYVRFLSKFKLLFLEKRYSFYTLLFILNIAIGSILSNYGILRYSFLLEPELVETFIYLLFIFDTHSKLIKKT